MRAEFESPYYPYEKVQEGFPGFRGAELIPMKVIRYLMDLPDAEGYEPADDNNRPRVRLMKYLWHDEANPLAKPMPTTAEKISLLWDGNQPDINDNEQKERHPKGYRLYPQVIWMPVGLEAKTLLKVYVGRIYSVSNYVYRVSVVFDIWVNGGNDGNLETEAYSRAYAMEQCIVEALNGVNMTGIGTFSWSRMDHGDNNSTAIYDEGNNVGRRLRMSLSWAE
jgi:hypothetical protein